MKRVFAFLLALAIVFSLGVNAFAAEETGSIKITNATIEEDYTAYKIFDANIKLDADGKREAVAYSIEKTSQFFAPLFGEDGASENPFFVYNVNTGSVTKKENVNDAELIAYLTELVAEGEFEPAVDPVEATSDEVLFDGIPYGYYLITSTLGTTVTINSNTPHVEVIDKNQEPAPDFTKLVQDGVDAEGNPIWKTNNSANIGDKITYKIEFTATNYDGDKQIKHYQIHDEKGEAIWAEFNSFKVTVGGVELEKGYYLSQGGVNTEGWEFLGDWSDIPEAERDRNDADWYLVHLGYDTFRITIPWLEGHEVTDVTDETTGEVTSYLLKYPAEEARVSKYDSPATVVITYDAMIEPGASIGSTTHGNRFNKANASWTSESETNTTSQKEVVTNVYGIAVLKDDIATGKNLAGAKFRVYRDEACTIPVYVIPTNIKGVYIVDSLGSDAEDFSGDHKVLARDVYAAYLSDYLGENTQDNYVVSQANGKLVVIGLEKGTYYLREVEAPDGYNALTLPVAITAGEGIKPFYIYANDAGEVADIQAADGTYKENIYEVTSYTVHNSKGVELPSTGGEGKIMLLTFGSFIAMAFAVLMITQKKMSIYKD